MKKEVYEPTTIKRAVKELRHLERERVSRTTLRFQRVNGGDYLKNEEN